jgi:beta-galactosidase
MEVLVKKLRLSILFIMAFNILAAQKSFDVKREKLLMDFNWRFAFGHSFDPEKDFGNGTSYFSYFAKAGYGDGAAAPNFDDRAWRKLDLPHDWAVEQPFNSNASYSHGFKTVGRNFPETSVGWYRKIFSIPSSDSGKKISIVFDGVFRNSTVWVNGHYLGTEQTGYTGFQYDLTDVLNYGGDNVIAVRVDATMEEGWFYEGAGIYRHTWLVKTSPLHVADNGTFITSEIKQNNSDVNVKTEVVNEGREIRSFDIVQTVVDADGKRVAQTSTKGVRLNPFERKELRSFLSISNAKLWDLESTYLYKLITEIVDGNAEVDRYETLFGIRSIRFDAKEGFFLNGRHIKLKGTNNHQDHAGVGTAMPDQLMYWRIKTLKEMGCNAYRCSHNPPAPELLEACDRLGILVLDENRLMRTTADGLNEFKKMIVRDRNHPCIIAWSIGNEEWAIENNTTGERIATTLQNFAKSLDSTRPTTAGISGGFRTGISDVLEVMGYNYLGNGDIDAHHQQFPNQPGMGTEEGSTFATRGIYVTDDNKHYHAAYDQKPRSSFYSIEEGWKFYAARPYLSGMFIWTGFDYRGEPTPYGWPSVTSYFGMMDLCGFPKDNVYYLKSWWTDQPVLHILPHWNWQGKEGKPIDVWVYSNCDEVEVFLNKKTLGRKKMEQYGHVEWKVNYTPGTLEAVGYRKGQRILTDVVKTTDNAESIQLTGKTFLNADGEDISVIKVEGLDKNKLFVTTANNEITFTIQGPGKIIGVGNGDPASLEKEKFIETIQTIKIENLKEKEAGGMKVSEKDFSDDTTWKEAFKDKDYHKLAKAYIYRGNFVLPENYKTSDVTLFYKCIGREQTIYINGKQIASNLKEDEAAKGFILDKNNLMPGKNVIVIVATPISKKYEWENVNTDPGLIQLFTPAEQWTRKLFNGLAQIIVQTKKEAGEITLVADSPGLKAGTIKLKVNHSETRPAVD